MKTCLFFFALALGGLSACSPALTPTQTTPGNMPASPTTAVALTIEPSLPYEACTWVWAQESLPEITTALIDHLAAQGLQFDAEKTYAYAFGENCLSPDGEINRFATMETDFVVTAAIQGPGDASAKAEFAAAVLKLILEDFPPLEVVPGGQLGFVEFVFVDEQGESHRRVSLSDATTALNSGLTGEDLFYILFP